MNIVGPPLGKIGLVPPEIKEANINQAIVLMRTANSYDPKILLYCLLSVVVVVDVVLIMI
jgi:type I restriction enzyme, S subunit